MTRRVNRFSSLFTRTAWNWYIERLLTANLFCDSTKIFISCTCCFETSFNLNSTEKFWGNRDYQIQEIPSLLTANSIAKIFKLNREHEILLPSTNLTRHESRSSKYISINNLFNTTRTHAYTSLDFSKLQLRDPTSLFSSGSILRAYLDNPRVATRHRIRGWKFPARRRVEENATN